MNFTVDWSGDNGGKGDQEIKKEMTRVNFERNSVLNFNSGLEDGVFDSPTKD